MSSRVPSNRSKLISRWFRPPRVARHRNLGSAGDHLSAGVLECQAERGFAWFPENQLPVNARRPERFATLTCSVTGREGLAPLNTERIASASVPVCTDAAIGRSADAGHIRRRHRGVSQSLLHGSRDGPAGQDSIIAAVVISAAVPHHLPKNLRTSGLSEFPFLQHQQAGSLTNGETCASGMERGRETRRNHGTCAAFLPGQNRKTIPDRTHRLRQRASRSGPPKRIRSQA